jgi:hypothetical protein
VDEHNFFLKGRTKDVELIGCSLFVLQSPSFPSGGENSKVPESLLVAAAAVIYVLKRKGVVFSQPLYIHAADSAAADLLCINNATLPTSQPFYDNPRAVGARYLGQKDTP